MSIYLELPSQVKNCHTSSNPSIPYFVDIINGQPLIMQCLPMENALFKQSTDIIV